MSKDEKKNLHFNLNVVKRILKNSAVKEKNQNPSQIFFDIKNNTKRCYYGNSYFYLMLYSSNLKAPFAIGVNLTSGQLNAVRQGRTRRIVMRTLLMQIMQTVKYALLILLINFSLSYIFLFKMNNETGQEISQELLKIPNENLSLNYFR